LPSAPRRRGDVQRSALRPARALRSRQDLRGGGTELVAAADLAELASGWIAARARGRSPFRIALTGGTTPRPVYERLAGLDLDWSSWHVWWSDDRVVPPDHPDSNERLAREALLSRVSVPETQIHPLRGVDVVLPERFDLVLLGLGSDGHTASLFPRHDDELADPGPLVYVPEPGLPPHHPRISFSLGYLNAQPLVAVLVAGEDKREILSRVLAGDEALPAARVRAAETVVLADEAAAPK
jgi:6-phosphogluconolactonase